MGSPCSDERLQCIAPETGGFIFPRVALPDASIDVVTRNGILNLVPDKAKAFSEIFRVLKPGGTIQISDIVLGKPIKESCKESSLLWAECIVGAVMEDECLDLFRKAGFTNVSVLSGLDYICQKRRCRNPRSGGLFRRGQAGPVFRYSTGFQECVNLKKEWHQTKTLRS